MTTAHKEIERRHDDRYSVRDGAFAMLSLQLVLFGHIIDISQGGLSFRYVASQERSQHTSSLSIVLADGTFSANRLAIMPVWDRAIPQDYALGSITVRHCGVRFNGLTAPQQHDLNNFLLHYTV